MACESRELKKADRNIKSLCTKIKPILEERTGTTFDHYQPVKYWSEEGAEKGDQIYGIKVDVGNDEYIHLFLKVDKEDTWLENYHKGKTVDDPID